MYSVWHTSIDYVYGSVRLTAVFTAMAKKKRYVGPSGLVQKFLRFCVHPTSSARAGTGGICGMPRLRCEIQTRLSGLRRARAAPAWRGLGGLPGRGESALAQHRPKIRIFFHGQIVEPNFCFHGQGPKRMIFTKNSATWLCGWVSYFSEPSAEPKRETLGRNEPSWAEPKPT